VPNREAHGFCSQRDKHPSAAPDAVPDSANLRSECMMAGEAVAWATASLDWATVGEGQLA
jgi:hypothetical protein